MSTHKAQLRQAHTDIREAQFLTNCDGVDGVGVAVIIAVVIELPSVATGYHKDAAEAVSACDYPMLQRCLRRKKIYIMLKREKTISTKGKSCTLSSSTCSCN